jgi:hypothetical protein
VSSTEEQLVEEREKRYSEQELQRPNSQSKPKVEHTTLKNLLALGCCFKALESASRVGLGLG